MAELPFITFFPEISPPPQYIVEEIYDVCRNNKDTYFLTKELSEESSEYEKYPTFKRYLITDNIKKWVDINFKDIFENKNYYAIIQVLQKEIPPHIDIGRSYTYNYILNCGGDKVITYWVKDEVNQNRLYETIIPAGIWHRINVNILHGIDNIESERIMLSVGNTIPISKNTIRQNRKVAYEYIKRINCSKA